MVVLMGIFISSWLLMRYGRVWVPITASAIGVALALPVWSWRSQEASLQHIDQELLALNAGKPYSMMQTTAALDRSEEHTSELQSLMRISYAVFCLKKKTINSNTIQQKHRIN